MPFIPYRKSGATPGFIPNKTSPSINGSSSVSSTQPNALRQIFAGSSTPQLGTSSTQDNPNAGFARSLLPTKEQLPAVLGATIASLFAGPEAGLAMSLLAPAAGGASGELAKIGYEKGQENLGLPQLFNEKSPPTMNQGVRQVGLQGLLGTGSGALGWLTGKLLHPFSSGTSPAAREAIELAKSEGVNPPLRTRTNSAFLKGAEGYAERSPAGIQITNQREDALANLRDFANRTVEGIGDKPLDQLDTAVKERLPAFRDMLRQTKDDLYDAVMPQLKDQPVFLPETVKTLKELVKKYSKTNPAASNKFGGLLSAVEGGGENQSMLIKGESPQISTFGDARDLRSQVFGIKGDFSNPAVSGVKSDWNKLYGTISDELDKSASDISPELGAKLRAADMANTEMMTSLKSSMLKKLAESKASDVPDLIIQNGFPEGIQEGRELLGEDTYNEVAGNWLKDKIQGSMTRDGTKTFIDPVKYMKKIDALGSSADEIFSHDPERQAAFDRLNKVMRLMSEAKYKPRGWSGDFLSKVVQSVLGSITSPVIASEFGKKFLTQGFPEMGALVKTAVQAGTEKYGQSMMNRK